MMEPRTEVRHEHGSADFLMRPLTRSDILSMAARASNVDKLEWYASTGLGILEALEHAVEACGYHGVHAALVDNRLMGIFGCRPAKGWGVPWAITTDLVHKYPKMFMRYSLAALSGMARAFPMLTNQIDARNVRALRWASRVGFEVFPAIPHGPFRMPFHPILMRGVVDV